MSRFTWLSAVSLCIVFNFAAAGQNSGTQTPVAGTPVAKTPKSAASRAVDLTNRYHRLICLVHLTGSGTAQDPRRPEYAPVSIDAGRQGIIAWSFQLTDDGTMAIVHFVAVNRNAFQPVFADARPEIRVFEIGKQNKAEIEAALRQYKANFSLDKFQMAAQ
jgi:hypothetical protein